MSTFRGTIKKLADTHATAFYQLKQGCGPLVNALFDHLSYNYPYTWDVRMTSLLSVVKRPMFDG